MGQRLKIVGAFLLATSLATHAQTPQAVREIHLQLHPKITKGVDAWPLIVDPRDDAERQINATLRGLNEKSKSYIRQCANDLHEGEKESGRTFDPKETANGWRAQIRPTMVGAKYLSFVETVDVFCGGTHPYESTNVAVFDLDTGLIADPLKWLMPSANAAYADGGRIEPDLERDVSAPAILSLYKELTKHDCDDVFEKDQPFFIWPDTRSGHVMIQADGLPGCCAACGVPVALSAEQASGVGFTEEFLQSVAEAHRQVGAVRLRATGRK